MPSESDRIARAGDYVLGLMNDRDRERAERDLQIDPAFRDTVMRLAERMHVFDRAPDNAPQDGWGQIKERIDAMPQMRPGPDLEPVPQSDPVPLGPQVTFGRRRSDKLRATIVPETPAKPIGTGLHSAPSRRALMLALCLIAAFALGYVAGVTSVSAPPAVATGP